MPRVPLRGHEGRWSPEGGNWEPLCPAGGAPAPGVPSALRAGTRSRCVRPARLGSARGRLPCTGWAAPSAAPGVRQRRNGRFSELCSALRFAGGRDEVCQRGEIELNGGGILEFPGITWRARNEHCGVKLRSVGTKAVAIMWWTFF